MRLNTNIYTTRLSVRPDDIDLFQHVHSSRYIDYVLAARFDQMERCYGCSMQEFMQAGYGWVLVSTEMHFKRPLKMGDTFDVSTHLKSFEKRKAHVVFDILHGSTGKSCCSGWALYTLVKLDTGKPAEIPDWVLERYSLPD
ncbi:MAG: acyl-CoA thioesterase [Bacteroidetes bacterium]|nr:acyl-CoA thioesterase [Bacteroidota bacterium]